MGKGNEHQNKFLTLYEPVHDKFDRFCRARVYGNIGLIDKKESNIFFNTYCD